MSASLRRRLLILENRLERETFAPLGPGPFTLADGPVRWCWNPDAPIVSGMAEYHAGLNLFRNRETCPDADTCPHSATCEADGLGPATQKDAEQDNHHDMAAHGVAGQLLASPT